ncbi:MAG: hypothetical protein L0229_32135 [Blastocatellia bacterium]|nr:hypothetical protein [Blastocatellia bacterium]
MADNLMWKYGSKSLNVPERNMAICLYAPFRDRFVRIREALKWPAEASFNTDLPKTRQARRTFCRKRKMNVLSDRIDSFCKAKGKSEAEVLPFHFLLFTWNIALRERFSLGLEAAWRR